ncbi:MAG: hypothetical protein Q8L70_08655 [Methylotenera sp.]|nr:hypothetical protein [Methylotenera sp.]MDP1958918.1 hypothetical protein [Methylotenera sp.]MDP3943532.1 hypothetical protein [Methylotenera sp.]
MNSQEKLLARVFFKNKVLLANGQAFEDLFTQIMTYSRPGFQPVNPQGKIGDRKNDGFESALGRYFQVFAPEDSTIKESATTKKIKTDFAGLHKHWQSQGVGIKEFYFVLNDKYNGAYPTTQTALNDLKTAYPTLDVADKFLCQHLEAELFLINDEQISYVVGGVLDPNNIGTVDYEILSEVLTHIRDLPPLPFIPGKLIAPILDEKIVFNGLVATRALLENSWHQCGVVDDYFKFESNFAKMELRDKLNALYVDAKLNNQSALDSDRGDLIFIEILENMIPNDLNNPTRKLYREAAAIIMAAFFDSCDIFEEPIIGIS